MRIGKPWITTEGQKNRTNRRNMGGTDSPSSFQKTLDRVRKTGPGKQGKSGYTTRKGGKRPDRPQLARSDLVRCKLVDAEQGPVTWPVSPSHMFLASSINETNAKPLVPVRTLAVLGRLVRSLARVFNVIAGPCELNLRVLRNNNNNNMNLLTINYAVLL